MAGHSCRGLAWLAAATMLLFLPIFFTASATDVVKREPAPEPVPLPAAGKPAVTADEKAVTAVGKPAVTADKRAVTAAGKSATKKPLTGKKIAGHNTTLAGAKGNKKNIKDKKKGKNGTKKGKAGKKKGKDGKKGIKGKKKGKNGKKKGKNGKKKGKDGNKKGKDVKKKGKDGKKKGKDGKKKGKDGKKKGKDGKKKGKDGKKKGKDGKKKGKDGKKKGKSGKNGKKFKFGQNRANDSCVTDLINILAPLSNIWLFMNRQGIRIKAAADLQAKKKQKSADFQGTASALQDSLGGSMGNLTCGSSKIDPNNSTEYKDLKVLNQCNESVVALCSNSGYPVNVNNCFAINQQYIDATLPVTKSNQSAEQICSAVSAFNKNLLAQLKNCTDIVSSAERDLVNRRNNCTAAFISCRTAQRNSIKSVYDCKPGPAGAANKDDAKKQLEAATKVRDAAATMENNVNAALAAAGLANGPGGDGTLPAASGRSHRHRRQSTSDGTACLEVMNGMASGNKSAANVVGSASRGYPINMDSSNSAATSMSAVANRPNLAQDLGTCAKDSTTTRVIIAIVQIRVYIFWIRFWRINIIEVKIDVLVLSYELPSPSTVPIKPVATTPIGAATSPTTTAAAAVSTKAPSLGIRRQRIFQLLKNHVKRS